MEDRHTFSDPRPAPDCGGDSGDDEGATGGGPAWHVDIYRKGVPEPIDTLVINERTLPPRKNKKGKVIWRLPTEQDKLPNFGTDERRRIMELFKERKKTRKKSAKKSQPSSGGDLPGAAGGGIGAAVAAAAASVAPSPSQDDDAKQVSLGGGRRKNSKKRGGSGVTPSMGGCSSGEEGIDAAAHKPRDRNGGIHACGASVQEPDQQSSGVAAAAPPGFRPPQQRSGDADACLAGEISDLSVALPADSRRAGAAGRPNERRGPGLLRPAPAPAAPVPAPPPPPPPLDARYIIVPEADRPAAPPSPPTAPPPALPSMAVAAAKAFVDLYYPLVSHGLCSELALHYTPRAQKSVSVGGAHSVVAGREDIALQISGLAGSAFAVRGVVAQDTHDGRGAHVLVTGLVQTVGPGEGTGAGGVATPFAHSVSLVPSVALSASGIEGGVADAGGGGGESLGVDVAPFAFQIHNDALSLLSGDMFLIPGAGGAVQPPPPSQQHHNLQHQPPPPPRRQNSSPPAPARPPGLFD